MRWARQGKIDRHLTGERIAIIKPSALGDVVQALPLLPALRHRFPMAELTWIIQRPLRDLVSEHPFVDQIIEVEHRPTWSQALQTLRQLRQARFDLVLDLQGLLRSAIMTLATGARWRVGLETAREGADLATNVSIPGTGRLVPAHERYWRVAEFLGCGHIPREVWLTVPVSALHDARQLLVGLPRPLLAVQWGAKWQTKRWPISGMAEVLARAMTTYGAGVVIVGGKAESDECEELRQRLVQMTHLDAVRNLAGRTNIKQLAAVLSQADAMIGNDSGPVHLAAELGRPTLGIFTCTSPVRSGPPGSRHEFVSTELACAASYKKICPHKGEQHLACHRELTATRVWNGLVRLLEKNDLVRCSAQKAA